MTTIGSLLRERREPFISFEFFPPSDPAQLPAFYETAARLKAVDPLFASVTYGAGGGKQQNTLSVTAELVRRGFHVMAHLTCVGVEQERILGFLNDLRANGVQDVLALRGDAPADQPHWDWESGRFRHALDLVRFIRRQMPDMGVAVAGYPCPHPESSTFAADRHHLAEKIAAGADFVVTQLFFDVREYVELVRGLRAQGFTTPVIPGILPIQSFDSLRRVLRLCGANIPGKFYLELEEAHKDGGVEAVREAGLRFAVRQIRRLLDEGAPGIHLYTLNKADMCLRLVEEAGL